MISISFVSYAVSDTGNNVETIKKDTPEISTSELLETKESEVSIGLTTSSKGPSHPQKNASGVIKKNRIRFNSESFYQDFKRQQEEALQKTQQAADESQENVSKRLHRFSSYVDKFFAEEDYVQESYDSRLKLSLTSQFQQHYDPTLKPRINLSLALPNTQNRWRLRFQSDDNIDSENSTGNSQIKESTADSSFTTALDLTLKASKLVDIRANIGIKFKTPIDPFSRFRIRRSFLFEKIEFRLTETFEWRDSRGKTATNELDIEYPLSVNYFFRSHSETRYWDVESFWSGAQSFTLYDELSPKSVIAYAVGVHAQNEDELHLRKKDQVNDYWIETRYRKNFYKDWLFYQISPGLIRPRDYDFETLPRLELKLEAVYGRLGR